MNPLTIGAAVLITLLGAGIAIQTKRLEGCQQARVAFELAYTHLAKVTEEQNREVGRLQDASKKASERARIAREAAVKGRVAAQAEISRLKAKMGEKGALTCSEAVQEVRGGLKP